MRQIDSREDIYMDKTSFTFLTYLTSRSIFLSADYAGLSCHA
jgi:hypothetical protein